MNRPDQSKQEAVAGRLRAVLIRVAYQLPAITVGLVDELIDANECPIALDMLSEMLVEHDARLDPQAFADIAQLADGLGLAAVTSERLRPLVRPM